MEEQRKRQGQGQRNIRIFERTQQLSKYHDSFIGTPSLPGWEQTREFPSMKALLTVITDEDREVSKEELDAVKATLLAEIEEFQQGMRRNMVELLAQAGVLPPPAGPSTDGKERAIPVSWSGDETRALLDTPAAFFVCNAIRRGPGSTHCRRAYSYAGLMEHWLRDHPRHPWVSSNLNVSVAWDEKQQESPARLLSALGLPEGTPVSVVEERVRSGRAKCSCGVECTYGVTGLLFASYHDLGDFPTVE